MGRHWGTALLGDARFGATRRGGGLPFDFPLGAVREGISISLWSLALNPQPLPIRAQYRDSLSLEVDDSPGIFGSSMMPECEIWSGSQTMQS